MSHFIEQANMERYPNPLTPKSLQALMRDERYLNRFHPVHEAYFRFIENGFKRLYPSPSRHMDEPAPVGGPPSTVHVRAYAQSRDGNIVPVSEHYRSAPETGHEASLGDSSGLPPMKNPVRNGQIRGCDNRAGYGCGHFGARRTKSDGTKYSHMGIDIAVEAGQIVYSPVKGTVEDIGIDPYRSDAKKAGMYRGIAIRTADGHLVRVLYVNPLVWKGAKVEIGAPIGDAQDLSKAYPPRNGGRMTNHVHVDVKKGDDYKNPTGMLRGW